MPSDKLVTMMVGRQLHQLQYTNHTQPHNLLEVKNISGHRFSNISFTIGKGEIVALAGLVGAGPGDPDRGEDGIRALA